MSERWILLGREECGLCEEMAADLAALSEELTLPTIERVDVDTDPQWQRRYGLKIPVLLWGDEPIATTHLDPDEIRRLLRKRR